jgi:hypothetical protein
MNITCENNVNHWSISNSILKNQWDDERDILSFSQGSGFAAKWKCSLGHSWKAPIKNRVLQGKGCPYCSGNLVWPGFNDLATTHPDLLIEWDYAKNEILPEEISAGSKKIVAWLCKSNHSWCAATNNRTRKKYGCPYCSGRLPIEGKTDLETVSPIIANSWDHELNSVLPSKVLPYSREKYYWKCQGHSWKASVADRMRGRDCSICANRTILIGFNDLATTHPFLANEWDEISNKCSPNSVVAGSTKKVTWKCVKNHSWEATVRSRAIRGTGCPECSLKATSKIETLFRELSKNILTEVNDNHLTTIPLNGKRKQVDILGKWEKQQIIIEYDGWYFHKDKLEKDIRDSEAMLSQGYILIRIRENARGSKLDSLKITNSCFLEIEFYYDHTTQEKIAKKRVEETLATIQSWLEETTS